MRPLLIKNQSAIRNLTNKIKLKKKKERNTQNRKIKIIFRNF